VSTPEHATWDRGSALLLDAVALTASWALVVGLRSAFHGWWPFDLFPGDYTLAEVRLKAALPYGVLVVPLWLAMAAPQERGKRRFGELGASLAAFVLFQAILSFAQLPLVSRSLVAGFTAVAIPALWLSRHSHAAVRRSTTPIRHVLQVGRDEAWAQHIQNHPETRIELHGPVPARPEAVYEALVGHSIDEVHLAAEAREAMAPIARLCDLLGTPVSLDANWLGLTRSQANVHDVAGQAVLTFRSGPSDGLALATKRVIDVVGAAAVLILTLPVLVVAALAIRLGDGGPVLFRQERAGLHGRRFTILKLRTMVVDAEDRREALMHRNERQGAAFKIKDDPRVTRVGRLLRRTSIDELPQLVNVLRGQMSLVGPRPAPLDDVARFEPWQLRRMSMKPGITGNWQVRARSEPDVCSWTRLDLEYIDRWSLRLDLILIVRTLPAILRGVGAY
jgi:exopolysaccharide biosynthesis polyprenyl glycosylphosphotransferase